MTPSISRVYARLTDSFRWPWVLHGVCSYLLHGVLSVRCSCRTCTPPSAAPTKAARDPRRSAHSRRSEGFHVVIYLQRPARHNGRLRARVSKKRSPTSVARDGGVGSSSSTRTLSSILHMYCRYLDTLHTYVCTPFALVRPACTS